MELPRLIGRAGRTGRLSSSTAFGSGPRGARQSGPDHGGEIVGPDERNERGCAELLGGQRVVPPAIVAGGDSGRRHGDER